MTVRTPLAPCSMASHSSAKSQNCHSGEAHLPATAEADAGNAFADHEVGEQVAEDQHDQYYAGEAHEQPCQLLEAAVRLRSALVLLGSMRWLRGAGIETLMA